MRISICLLTLLFSLTSFGATEAEEIKQLFAKYDQVMQSRKVELVDEVFTKKFLTESGGKEEFIDKVKDLPLIKASAVVNKQVSWKKGLKGDVFFAQQADAPTTINKNPYKKSSHSGSEFILVREAGKLKIDGTLSDAD